MKKIGKLKYIGKNIDLNSLVNGETYEVTEIFDENIIRVIDGTGEAYLFSAKKPASLLHPENCGKWEIVEDPSGELSKVIEGE